MSIINEKHYNQSCQKILLSLFKYSIKYNNEYLYILYSLLKYGKKDLSIYKNNFNNDINHVLTIYGSTTNFIENYFEDYDFHKGFLDPCVALIKRAKNRL